MNILVCFQTPYDTVKYITNNLSSPTFLSYYKFIDYIQTIFLYDYVGFKEQLNKFKTIMINLDEHSWEICSEQISDVSFKELLKLNEKKDEEEKSFIERAKEFTKKFNKKSIKKIVDVDKYDTRNSNRRSR